MGRRIAGVFATLVAVLTIGTAAQGNGAASGATEAGREVSVTTFNIRFYGLNGESDGALGTETRDQTIRRFLTDHDLLADVLVLEEIVDTARLESKVLPAAYKCHTYQRASGHHQHVMVCVRPPWRFSRADDDDNLVLEDVDLGNQNLRPALHGILTDGAGEAVAHLVAVHLKAGVDSAEFRDRQMGIIADYLRARPDQLPVILTGDFNTHGNDAGIFSSMLRQADPAISEVRIPAEYTFRVPDVGYKFDRFWVTRRPDGTPVPEVKGPCNAPAADGETIKKFNAQVSDHCAVKLRLRY